MTVVMNKQVLKGFKVIKSSSYEKNNATLFRGVISCESSDEDRSKTCQVCLKKHEITKKSFDIYYLYIILCSKHLLSQLIKKINLYSYVYSDLVRAAFTEQICYEL